MVRLHRLSAFCGVLLAALGCDVGGPAAPAAPPERPPPAVTTAAAVVRDVPVYLEKIGRTAAVNTIAVVPRVGGVVTGVHVEDGAYVKKGQLLFEIDRKPFEAALASVKAAMAQAKAEREFAEIDFDNTKDLISRGDASKMEFDDKRSKLGVAEAKVHTAEASITSAELDLGYTTISSPIDGRAGARMIDPGNVVKANETVLQEIRQLDPIYVEFTVTENELGEVRKQVAAQRAANPTEQGLSVLVDIPEVVAAEIRSTSRPATPSTTAGSSEATAGVARGDGPRQGRLTFLDNVVKSETGTVKLRATLDNADRYFWPGQFVNVRLVLRTVRDAVLIPAQARQIGQQGPYVYVVRPDGVADLRPITLGQTHGELLAVQSGLSVGEKVIVTGQMSVMPGKPVRDLAAAPPPGTSTAEKAGGAAAVNDVASAASQPASRP